MVPNLTTLIESGADMNYIQEGIITCKYFKINAQRLTFVRIECKSNIKYLCCNMIYTYQFYSYWLRI